MGGLQLHSVDDNDEIMVLPERAKGTIYRQGSTGTDLSQENLSTAQWSLTRQPYLLETSLPGVFAVGDVRGGSIKRVASAVGEGSTAISIIHKVLQE